MINVKILTPDKSIYDKQALKLTLTTTTGEICVLAGHEPLITTIDEGMITILDMDNQVLKFNSKFGLAHIENIKGNTNAILLLESSESK